MAQSVSRQPLAAEARVRSQPSPCGICGGPSGTETGLSPSTSVFSSGSAIPPMLHTHLHLNTTIYQNGRSLGTFQKAMLFQMSDTTGQRVLVFKVLSKPLVPQAMLQ